MADSHVLRVRSSPEEEFFDPRANRAGFGHILRVRSDGQMLDDGKRSFGHVLRVRSEPTKKADLNKAFMMRVRKEYTDKRADFNRMYTMRVRKNDKEMVEPPRFPDYEGDEELPPLDLESMIENNTLDENLDLLKQRLLELKRALVGWDKKQSLFHALRVRRSDFANKFALRV